MNAVDQILELYVRRGGAEYGGECVTQLQHALQCATLAEDEGVEPSLIAAALLHDIGHLVHNLGENPAGRGVDDRHEMCGREWLAQWFGEDVTEPVRQHVNAKRFLTATDPAYRARLSPASLRSLELQGGPFSIDMAAAFIALPHAAAAVRLRRWDEAAKVATKPTPGLAHFRPFLGASLARP